MKKIWILQMFMAGIREVRLCHPEIFQDEAEAKARVVSIYNTQINFHQDKGLLEHSINDEKTRCEIISATNFTEVLLDEAEVD